MSNVRVSDRVSQSLGAAKNIMEDTVLLAQKDHEIAHLKQKVGRLEERLEAKDKRLRDQRKTVEAAIKPNTKLIFSESPANPTLTLTDLSAVSVSSPWPRP